MPALPSPAARARSRPRPWFRRLIVAAAALAALTVAIAGWIVATFDPNAWKPVLIEHVARDYQRTLTLDGNIRISWFPGIGAEVGGISLSERAGSAEFAGAEQARVSLALLPLLRGQVVIRELVVRGPRATLVTRRDGTRNVDDLLAPAGGGRAGRQRAGAADPSGPGGPAIELDIGRIVIEKGRFTARDERTGQVLSLVGVDLTTGRLGGNATEPFALAATLQASEPKLDLRIEARGRLLVDLAGGRYGASTLALAVSGATADGPIDAKLGVGRLFIASRWIDLEALKLNLRRGDEKRSLALELSLPSVNAVDQAFKGAPLAIVVDYRSGPGTLINLRAGATLQGRLAADGIGLERLEAPEIKADIDGRLSGHTVQGSARGQAVSDLAAGRHELQRFSIKATLFGLDAPVRDITLAIDGTATAGGAHAGALAVAADGRLNESTLRARLSREAADRPLIFDLEADQFDLDRYRPAHAAAAGKPAAPGPGDKAFASGAGDKPVLAGPGGSRPPAAQALDFSFLDGLELIGAVRIGSLRAAGLRAANVRIDVKATGGRLDASPMVASLYGGRLEGGISLVNAKLPRVIVRQQLTGVQIGPLLADAARLDLVEGRATVRLDLSAQGASTDALRRALSGSAAVHLVDGALRGVDMAGVLREARAQIAQLRGREARASAPAERTGFSELKASFMVREGVARSSDLSMRSAQLRAGGDGAVDIGAGTIDYLLLATVVGTPGDLRGISVPVRISGPLSEPHYDFDLQAMAAGAIRQELQQRGAELLRERPGTGGEPAPAARPSPADLLKGILRR